MRIKLLALVMIAVFVASCGNSSKDRNGEINDKKAELQDLKMQQTKLKTQIDSLEAWLLRNDPSSAKMGKAKLVALTPVSAGQFDHYVELQGKVDAENISYVAPPNGQGGIVTALYVKQGQYVRKGQLLARLDAQMIRQNIEPLKVQLSAAEDTYRRTKKLWDEGIGTYQNVLNAQTQVESLRKQIGIVQRQASLMNVTAPSSGVADQVNVRVGEAFVGATAAGPQIRIVNTANLKIVANVPENYLGRIGEGSTILVQLPNTNRAPIEVKVAVAGKVIDPTSRSFQIEAPIPSDPNFKPNQIAIVKIRDYAATDAVTIPLNTLQNDEQGKFVMVAMKEKNIQVARKRRVIVGELYGDRLEVKSGLQPGDLLITQGFQELYEGQPLQISANAPQ
jgi:membrane fusion protein (multidrug efflux system)